jgi:hypothetical protein
MQGKLKTLRAAQEAQEAQRNDIEHLDGNLQMVATATHEIESSIAEIAHNLEPAARRTSEIANMRIE